MTAAGRPRRTSHGRLLLISLLCTVPSVSLASAADDNRRPYKGISQKSAAVHICIARALESVLDCRRRDEQQRAGEKRNAVPQDTAPPSSSCDYSHSPKDDDSSSSFDDVRDDRRRRLLTSDRTSVCDGDDSKTAGRLSECLRAAAAAEERTVDDYAATTAADNDSRPSVPADAVMTALTMALAPAAHLLEHPTRRKSRRCRNDAKRYRADAWKCLYAATLKKRKECERRNLLKLKKVSGLSKWCRPGDVVAGAERLAVAMGEVLEAVVTYLAMLESMPEWTGPIQFVENVAWASRSGMSRSFFEGLVDEYVREGSMMMVDMDVSITSSGRRYGAVWQENVDRRRWRVHWDLSSDEYGEKWRQYKDEGYRPLQVEGYRDGRSLYYAGIWIENVEGHGWSSKLRMSNEEYLNYFEEQVGMGRRMINFNSYEGMYSGIWWDNRDGIGWEQFRNMGREDYQNKANEMHENGYLIVSYESYKIDGEQKYAAIWEKNVNNSSYQIRTDLDKIQYANYIREYNDRGYRIVNFKNYNKGTLYGGIWIRNVERHTKSSEIDNKINAERLSPTASLQSDRTTPVPNAPSLIPGISVAVVLNGKDVYRRGFGWADEAAGKVAHSQTVYNAASVAKLFAGTLASSLAMDGPKDGSIISFDLDEPTMNYIGGTGWHLNPGALPHTHTPRQLLAHIGCIPNYGGMYPTVPNTSNHYENMTSAAKSHVWPVGLMADTNTGKTGIQNCTVGSSYSYSTAAYTLLGAVMETITGRDAHTLLRTEITQPLGLTSTRAQFETPSLVPDYDRAVPYVVHSQHHHSTSLRKEEGAGAGYVPTNYPNNSWKFFGAGMESSALDLARFGDDVRRHRVVASAAAASDMWTRVPPSKHGAGWRVFGTQRRRAEEEEGSSGTRGRRWIASHGGSWAGARSYLAVYPDDGLSIAIMSNINQWNPRSLNSEIAEIVLG